MIMTPTHSASASTSSISTSSSLSSTLSSPRSFTPPPTGSLAGRHVIYRGLAKSSMEYMSLTHSRYPEAAHMLKGEILISGQQSGYIQYTIVLDHEWMTRKVKMSSMFGNQEKRLVLEVDQDQRWYKVTEHRLARTRSFFRSGLSQSQISGDSSSYGSSHSSSSGRSESQCSMQDADASLSDSSASCYSSSSDSECSIPFEKINLTWTPPPKGAKRASKRFSSINPLGSKATTTASKSMDPVSTPPSVSTINESQHVAQKSPSASPSTTTTSSPSSTPTTSISPSPSIGFTSKALSRTVSTSSLVGPKKYEHLPQLDGCIHLDLGYDISPSTLLLPLKRSTLGVEAEKMREHLEGLSFDESTTEKSALVSFPDLEMHAIQTHLAFAGPGHKHNFSLIECWRDEEEDSTLVEVDGDGLVVRYGRHWARIPSS